MTEREVWTDAAGTNAVDNVSADIDPAGGDGARIDATGVPESDPAGGLGGDRDGAAPTTEQVLEALKVVVDPELGISVVDLGLVYDVQVEDDVVKVTYTLTSMGCPVGPLIEQQIQQVLTTIPGIAHVETTQTFDPPWSVDQMSEEARLAMGMF